MNLRVQVVVTEARLSGVSAGAGTSSLVYTMELPEGSG